jgi:ABC-type nitrate/sulfonate/bicarbonate transport system permease component
MATVFAVLVIFSLLGVILLEIMVWVERRVVFWRHSRRGLLAFLDGREGS